MFPINFLRKFSGWNWKSRLLTVIIILGLIELGNYGYWVWVYPYLKISQIVPLTHEMETKYELQFYYNKSISFNPLDSDRLSKKSNAPYQREPIDKGRSAVVLEGISDALRLYPPKLVKKYLGFIIITNEITISGVKAMGTYAESMIFIAASPHMIYGPFEFALCLHHEFSSLLLLENQFSTTEWRLINPPDFKYQDTYDEYVTMPDQKLAHQWYINGFVSDYGMTNMENDFNTYAELVFGKPEELRKLIAKYPRIAKKTKLLVKFYVQLAPEMCAYFKSVGLTMDCGE